MYFDKIDHPLNFRQAETPEMHRPVTGLFRLKAGKQEAERWKAVPNLLGLQERVSKVTPFPEDLAADWTEAHGFSLRDSMGNELLKSHPVMPFGVCGRKWLFSFSLQPGMRFFGMGEKNTGFEKTGQRSKFWNTDVLADFSWAQAEFSATDPMYASFPVLIVRRGSHWIGLLAANEYPVFMDAGARQVIEGVKDPGAAGGFFYLGSTDGAPELYICASRSFAEVQRCLQQLSGLPERPPLWALGYQQSRWGYRNLSDLEEIDEGLQSSGIPCDGLWLDIDYMDAYRVFTVHPEGFKDSRDRIARLEKKGRRVVPILDPGVKYDLDYHAARDGMEQDVFCKHSEGDPFVGFVWPGASLFPDFSLPEAREWWAEKTRELSLKYGFQAYWTDMNDPSTGSAINEEMLFRNGSLPHAAFHNLYGREMAAATREGLRRAFPEQRPFILSRSGATGSSESCAIWCGDSFSNYFHLRKGIEMALSMSISGMPYVGNDLGGFEGDTNGELMLDWFRANLLFPVFRNHSTCSCTPQEPWRFGPDYELQLRNAVRLRYAFLPYLYSLFVEMSMSGAPIIRPMLWECENEDVIALDDQFMIGDALLQAPRLEQGQAKRKVYLPEGMWLSLGSRREYEGGRWIEFSFSDDSYGLFLRAGKPVPLAANAGTLNSTADIDLSSPVFLLYLPSHAKSGAAGTGLTVSGRYYHDSGDGYSYRDSDAADDSCLEMHGSVRGNTLSLDCTAGGQFSCAAIALAGSNSNAYHIKDFSITGEVELLPGLASVCVYENRSEVH